MLGRVMGSGQALGTPNLKFSACHVLGTVFDSATVADEEIGAI